MPTVLIPRERREGERRVAGTPETVKLFAKMGLEVLLESGAGRDANIPDAAYQEAGATVVAEGEGWKRADLVLAVGMPSVDACDAMRSEAILLGMLSPYKEVRRIAELSRRKISSLAMELVPRISRAQKMDALSSQANIAGYKAVLLAANRLAAYFPLLMTAAGTVQPAKVVVMGAGVAGLQAIATARRLGAVVEVSDVRPEVKEQVESLGARFISLPLSESGEGEGGYAKELSAEDLRKQQQLLSEHIAAADVVITTALLPGKPAPRLVTAEMVAAMRPGSVIVDLAGEAGGNCELSVAGEEVERGGVSILAPLNLPATLATDASLLYARNVAEVAKLLVHEGKLRLDEGDEILGAMLLTHSGEIRHAPTRAMAEKEQAVC